MLSLSHKKGKLSDYFLRGNIMKKKAREVRQEAVEVVCPKCRETCIVYFPKESMPTCPYCKVEMIIKEVLTEGKYG